MADPRNSRLAERIALLGIPPEELTPLVSLALSALFDKLDDTNRELAHMWEVLRDVQEHVEIDAGEILPNRLAFQRRLQWALSMCQRYGHPSTLVQLDIDNIGHMTSTFGEGAAKAAWAHCLRTARELIRDSDYLACHENRTLLLLLYHADLAAGRGKAEQFIYMLRERPMMWNGQGVAIHIATGAYTIKPGDDVETALSSLDLATYLDRRQRKETQEQIANLKV